MRSSCRDLPEGKGQIDKHVNNTLEKYYKEDVDVCRTPRTAIFYIWLFSLLWFCLYASKAADNFFSSYSSLHTFD